MSELKPCPFCGDIPKPKPSKDECWWHECGCKTVIINYEEWNTRPIEDALRVELASRDEIITRLKEVGGRMYIAHDEKDIRECEDWCALMKELK